MGFWLTQKHCACLGDPLPACCPTGWQTVFCGSRFYSPAESRYHPIEGEGTATITGLEKCKFFVMGLENLILCIDHKPLIAILGDQQNLADIPNPRIMNFKLMSMMYRFKVKYIPGKDQVIPDAFSRRADSPIAQIASKSNIQDKMSNVLPGYSDSLGPPSWLSNPTVATLSLAPTYEEIQDSNQIDEFLTGVIIASIASITEVNSHSLLASDSLWSCSARFLATPAW
jgi:hypothetical protein